MIQVRFLTSQRVFTGSGELVEDFQAGKSYTLNNASAERWIRRGHAEAVAETPAPKPSKPSKPAGKKK